jgi:hypothetical protein
VLDVPADLGLPASFTVRDLLGGGRFEWRHGHNYVRLDPLRSVAHLMAVEAAAR